MKCTNCRNEINFGSTFISSSYGEFCSRNCWEETAEEIVGYFEVVRDEEEERKEEEERIKRTEEFKNIPKWGDDL